MARTKKVSPTKPWKLKQWLESQFGPRVRPVWAEKTDEDLEALIQEGQQAQRVLRQRLDWDLQTKGARYGWNVADKDKA